MKNVRFRNIVIPYSLLPWVGLVVVVTLLQGIPGAEGLMRYDRGAIAGGEAWRVLSGNFIHLGWGHLAFNMTGLLLIGWLFADQYRTSLWAAILAVCALVTGAGLYFLSPEILFCVGLSGVQHGLYFAGAVSWTFAGGPVGWLLLAAGAAKIAYEQIVGATPLSESVVGGAVATDAHIWGALGGILAALSLRLWQHWKISPTP